MEALEAIPEGVWNSIGGMYVSDEANSISQLLGNCTFPSEIESGAVHGVQPRSWPSYGSRFNLSITSGSASFSPEISVPYSSSYESYYLDDFSPVSARRDSSVPMDYYLNQHPREGTALQETRFQLELQYSQVNGAEFSPSGDWILSYGVPGKRSRSSEDLQLHKITGTGRSKVARKLDFATNNEEEATAIPSSSPCNSEYDSNRGVMTCSNLSPKGSALCNAYLMPPSPNSKTRGSQGSASDPQSLYARKRREKISERLRILQNLVPNGTKVDISTMLEEAVHYVKFLQLQIKLLSSDELWMYAPIAYNGMDIELDKAVRRRQL